MGFARLVLICVAMVMHTTAQWSPERFLSGPSSGPSSGPETEDNAPANTTATECENCVVLTMQLTVPDPQAFVADEDNAAAIAAGIANATEVDLAAVEVVLRLVSRRLGSHGASGNVIVEATIQADNAAAVSTLQESVDAVSATEMADALNAALEVTGVTVQVASMETRVDSSAGPSIGESAAFKAADVSKVVLGLVAQLVFFSF